MKVKLFVAYLRRDLAHSAPFVVFGFPYFVYMWVKNVRKYEGDTFKYVALDRNMFCGCCNWLWGTIQLLKETYPNWYMEEREDGDVDMDSLVPAKADRAGNVGEDGTEQPSLGSQVQQWEKSCCVPNDGEKQHTVNRSVLPPKTRRWIYKLRRLFKAAFPDESDTSQEEVEVCGVRVMEQFEKLIKNAIKSGIKEEFEFEALLQEQKSLAANQKSLAANQTKMRENQESITEDVRHLIEKCDMLCLELVPGAKKAKEEAEAAAAAASDQVTELLPAAVGESK